MQNFDNDFIIRLLKLKGIITQEDIDEINRQRQEELKETFIQEIACKIDRYRKDNGHYTEKEFECCDGVVRLFYPYEEFTTSYSSTCYYACFFNDNFEITQERFDSYDDDDEIEEDKKPWWKFF